MSKTADFNMRDVLNMPSKVAVEKLHLQTQHRGKTQIHRNWTQIIEIFKQNNTSKLYNDTIIQ